MLARDGNPQGLNASPDKSDDSASPRAWRRSSRSTTPAVGSKAGAGIWLRDSASYPVQIYTLGSFALLKQGAWVSFGSRMRKPVLLLKALVALGGREIAKQQLIDLLWPDAEGDAAQRVFITTLYRLRRLIGQEAVISAGGCVALNVDRCWVDCWVFEAALEHAKGLPPAQQEERLQQALTLYQGCFLPAQEDYWSIALRERLSRKFLQAVSNLGNFLEARRAWADACLCYERGLEMETLAEELYQRLIVCYSQLGQRSQALRVYERCRAALATFLGVAPSAQTQALYQALRVE